MYIINKHSRSFNPRSKRRLHIKSRAAAPHIRIYTRGRVVSWGRVVRQRTAPLDAEVHRVTTGTHTQKQTNLELSDCFSANRSGKTTTTTNIRQPSHPLSPPQLSPPPKKKKGKQSTTTNYTQHGANKANYCTSLLHSVASSLPVSSTTSTTSGSIISPFVISAPVASSKKTALPTSG